MICKTLIEPEIAPERDEEKSPYRRRWEALSPIVQDLSLNTRTDAVRTAVTSYCNGSIPHADMIEKLFLHEVGESMKRKIEQLAVEYATHQ
jgi:hypothetical protein